MVGFSEGKLEKLTIYAYADSEYTKMVAEYEALINPAEYSEKYSVKYGEVKSPGTKTGEKQFYRIDPPKLDLQFVFDASGVLADKTNPLSEQPVPKQVDEFLKSVYQYDGEIHQPRFVQVIWGEEKEGIGVFKGRLDAVEIKYTLFKPDGTPIRAVANASFSASLSKETEEKVKNNSSPDLSHIRIVGEGDTLPLMAFRIYGDSSYYLEVARVNKLRSFRKLTVGQRIYFPPINKKSA